MINVAILGAGIGREHLAAYRVLSDHFQVTHVVDRDQDRIEEIRYGDTFVAVSEISEVLDNPNIDLIDVCLPPHLHVETSVQALKKGKNTICEKPIATSLADLERIMAAQAEAGKMFFPVFQYRWGPSLAQLRHLISQGLTGRPQVASIETHWSRDAEYYAVPWRGTWAGEQGGAVLGHAIHNHDLLQHIMGPLKSVSAFTTTRVNDIETEDCAVVAIEMANGALATSNITLGAAFDRTRIRFVFENLTATSGDAPYAPGSDPWRFEARDPAQQAVIDAALVHAPAEHIGFTGFLAEVAKAIANAPHAAVSFEDGRSSIELVTAIYHAARTGTRVTLPLSGSHPLYEGWHP